jgi:uncharacterized protein (DUF427 family)
MEMKTTGTIDRAGRVRLEQGRKRVRAYLAGNVVADTTQPRLVWEVPYYPAYYFPVEDVRTDLLVPTATVSHSPSRGDAQHFTVKAGSREAEDAALRYVDSPIEELRDLIRLDWNAMDGWFEEDEEVYTHPPKTDLRMDLLVPTGTVTHCPYKGRAHYWSARAGGRLVADLAWSYRAPLPESQKIAGLVAFYNERVDLFIDDQLQQRPVTKFQQVKDAPRWPARHRRRSSPHERRGNSTGKQGGST